MSDREDDFIAKAKQEGQILHDHGVRVERNVSPASLGERIPVNSPQPEKANHMVRMSNPITKDHPTDRPAATVSESDLRRGPVQLKGGQDSERGKVLANRDGDLSTTDKAAGKAAEKSAEQAKVQQQAPPTQDR